ncbi:hypothetical protein SLEP1_g41802 [Rubroshorea leprosula]|uniref:Disease resistance protein RGA3 n=1 Tax=Rubroshorea leprosula TaxID=152421 RepID=A0AAV5L7R1_9ROSI|nr:hypothetical protein SLEP1_g41802 [Rubroshorea leprosula]
MAEIALTFLSPVIEVAISKMFSFGKERIGNALGLEKELDRLVDSLTLIQSVVQHAEERQESDPAVRRWLQKLNDVAYEAVDALDECEYKVLEDEVKRVWHWNPAFIFSSQKFRVHMTDKIKKITEELCHLKDSAATVNLVVTYRGQTCSMQYPKTDSFLNSVVFGREDDVSIIVRLLRDLSSKHLISGISIVGMAGVGKTTVARSVYNEAKVKKLYDLVAWVCVSEDFTDQTILGEMLRHFDRTAAQTNSVNALLEDLSKELEKKTFLLILDDVWNDDRKKWDSFSSCLSKILKTNGSSIVATTRSGKVASVMESIPMQSYKMQGLSDNECWLIIKEKFLRSSTGATSMPADLEPIGQDIAKRCGGSPLIASVIGGTLSRQANADTWEAIKNDEAWQFNSGAGDEILPILKISFDRLPSPLKKCFSYCAIFPKDFVIEKNDLVQLWMAVGFLEQSKERDKTMEAIGNDYFNHLLANSLFQDVEMDEYANIKSCKMHDAVHDLALFVSKGEVLIWEESGCNIVENSKVRHLRIKSEGKTCPTIPADVQKGLHSLFSSVHAFTRMASDLESLRSLKLGGDSMRVLPNSFGKLKHLRYLDISKSAIQRLPKSVTKFYNLLTLRFMDCISLEKLPSGTKNLVSLRHIYSDDERHMPSGIGKLTSLQTLPPFVVGTEKGRRIEELKSLNQLRGKLKIYKLDLVSQSEAREARLKDKRELIKLKFVWSKNRANNSDKDMVVLEGLEPPSTLKCLTIENYRGGICPSWMMNLEQLVKLTLIDCDGVGDISCLELLPELKVLNIKAMPNVRRIGRMSYRQSSSMAIDSRGEAESILPFPALRKLTLHHMKKLEKWTEAQGMLKTWWASSGQGEAESILPFPALRKLALRNMTKLEKWTQAQGMVVFPCLEELHIRDCPELKTWWEDGFACPNLSVLGIQSCLKLRAIPIGLSNLTFLDINNCPKLMGYAQEGSHKWLSICHAHRIRINGQIVLSRRS